MAEAPMQEHRDGGERCALVALHEIGADIGLAYIELGPARHAPVALAWAHPGEHDELEAVGFDRAFLERAHDLVVAARDGELELSRHRLLHHSVCQRPKCTSARRTISLSTIAMAASTEIRPKSRVGSKFCVNSVVKYPMPAVDT